MDLGILKRVDLRRQWPNEASDFTPWLASDSQIAAIGDAIGLELELVNTEVQVGPYSADILAKDAGSEKYVVIENQLEKTNHDHLGKCLTYAAVLDASSIVWVAKEFTEEHKKALDWLNDHTTDEVGFYGVIVELLQIDDSSPAVQFNIVSKPANIVRQAAISKSSGALSEARQLQYEFWNAFRQKLLSKREVPSVQSARPQYWFDVSLGRSGFVLSNVANTDDNFIGVRVYMTSAVADSALVELETEREAIEKEIGQALKWNPNPHNRDKIIALTRAANLRQKEHWEEYLDWLVETTVKFRKAFSARVRKLTLDSVASDDGGPAT